MPLTHTHALMQRSHWQWQTMTSVSDFQLHAAVCRPKVNLNRVGPLAHFGAVIGTASVRELSGAMGSAVW